MPRSFVGSAAFLWGVGGIAALLIGALSRLLPHALESLHYSWTWWQGILVVVWIVFMVVSEGYDGFQKRLLPRVYARATALYYGTGHRLDRVLAPLYCLNYFHAELRRMIIAYTALILIVAAVIVVHALDQPLRGMIDWGVVAGLGYGLAVLVLRLPGAIKSLR